MPRKTAGIMPCTNEHCRYPTRPEGWVIEKHPNTRQRRGGKCRKCHDAENPAPAPKKKKAEGGPPNPVIVAGLETFMAGRYRREAAAARRQYPNLYRKATA